MTSTVLEIVEDKLESHNQTFNDVNDVKIGNEYISNLDRIKTQLSYMDWERFGLVSDDIVLWTESKIYYVTNIERHQIMVVERHPDKKGDDK